jgi:hypothetical protein
MAAPEWAKLDDLSRDIADAQVRLKGAKSSRRLELAAAIEQEIDEMDERRSHLFGQIADNLAGEPSGSTGAVRAATPVDVSSDASDRRDGDHAEPQERDRKRMGDTVWNQLTAADVERARQELERQRTDMLARHVEEMKSLDADGSDIGELEQAIEAFMRKFGGTAAGT